MSISNTRIIIVTYDTNFYNILLTSLLALKKASMILTVKTIKEAENKINVNSQTILILDIDTSIVTNQYLSYLTSKFNVLIILTGGRTDLANLFINNKATSFILKPLLTNSFSVNNYIRAISDKINEFAAKPLHTLSPITVLKTVDASQKIVAIASSTGGTEALEKILKELPADFPPVLIVQHMPSGFTKLFADRLNNVCRLMVKEASNNDYLQKGIALIAPADYHMTLTKINNKLAVSCFIGKRLHGVMPSADILFESIAPIMKSSAIGVILTGMGADGAKGLFKMHLSGAKTIGQNKETCIVYGMPKVAFDMGAVDKQLPIDKIADELIKICR